MAARSTSKRRSKTRSKTPRIHLTSEYRRLIAREAKAVGLTTNEYMRLIVGLASSLRESFGDDKKVEGRQLLQLVENPLFVALLKTVMQSVALPNEDEQEEQQSPSPQPNPSPLPRPQGNQPMGPLPYYYPYRPQRPIQPMPQQPAPGHPRWHVPEQPLPAPQPQPVQRSEPNAVPTQSVRYPFW